MRCEHRRIEDTKEMRRIRGRKKRRRVVLLEGEMSGGEIGIRSERERQARVISYK